MVVGIIGGIFGGVIRRAVGRGTIVGTETGETSTIIKNQSVHIMTNWGLGQPSSEAGWTDGLFEAMVRVEVCGMVVGGSLLHKIGLELMRKGNWKQRKA